MRIFVHDYAGHPFQVHLSRQLALRGHDVTHGYFAGDPGPKGMLRRQPDDPASLEFAGFTIDRHYDKSSLVQRRFNDLAYGRRVASFIRESRLDVVISGNTPTEAQAAILGACKEVGSAFVYWLQDFYSIAVSKLLRQKMRGAGQIVGLYYRWLERSQLRDSDAVVIISEDFRPLASAWAGGSDKVHTIANWAALDEIPLLPKDNPWSQRHDVHRDFTYVYSGTLGTKHNPELLLKLAQQCGPSGSVVVVAQGAGMKRLEAAKAEQPLDALKLLPLQPVESLPEVLAAGDVLIAMIEPEAGTFSVPSKVQSYLCAGRPILLAAPQENLAARVVVGADAGIVVTPEEVTFISAALRLRNDQALRSRLGANGRAYAERAFDMVKIADAFESILTAANEQAQTRRPVHIPPKQKPTRFPSRRSEQAYDGAGTPTAMGLDVGPSSRLAKDKIS